MMFRFSRTLMVLGWGSVPEFATAMRENTRALHRADNWVETQWITSTSRRLQTTKRKIL
jgi:hypothetical protein